MSLQRTAISRRHLLSALSGIVIPSSTGCLGSRRDAPATDTRTQTTDSPQTPTETTTDYRRVEITVTKVTATEVGEGVLRGSKWLEEFEAALIHRAVTNGMTTFTTVMYTPLSARIYIAREGAYYRITRSVTAEQNVTAHKFLIRLLSSSSKTTSSATNPLSYEALSEADQHTFSFGLRDELEEVRYSSAGRRFVYSPDAERTSVLINESPTYVRYGDEIYIVHYEGTGKATETTFRFDATRLGQTKQEYVQTVVPEVVWAVDASTLSADEQTFFQRLLEEGSYMRENPIPAYVDTFLNRVLTNAYTHPVSDRSFLEYQGDYYCVRFSVTVI